MLRQTEADDQANSEQQANQKRARFARSSTHKKAHSQKFYKPPTDELNDEPEEQELNQRLREFYETHGVSFKSSAVYTHSAQTLKRDESLVVLFQTRVASGQKLVDYNYYRSYKETELDDLPSAQETEPGPFFSLIQTKGQGKQMICGLTRRVDPNYVAAIFSPTQKFVCMRSRKQHVIDVYFCGGSDLSFFEREATLDRDCKEFLFSLRAGQDCLVEFSEGERYLAIIFEKLLNVYELECCGPDDSRMSINSESNQPVHEYLERYKAELLHSFTLNNKTYSAILRVHLSEESEQSSQMALHSWVVLESRRFNTLHFIVLRDLINQLAGGNGVTEEEEEKNAGPRLLSPPQKQRELSDPKLNTTEASLGDLGMNFYVNPTLGHLFNFSELEDHAAEDIVFQKDGSFALVHTGDQIVQVNLAKDAASFPEKRVTVDRVPVVDPSGTSLFTLGRSDMVFCKADVEQISVTLTTHNLTNPSLFPETLFEIDGNVEILEIYESMSESFERPFLRMIGIRDCEELLVWEAQLKVSDDDSSPLLSKTLKIYNRQDRACFRWPYFAQTMGEQQVVVNYLQHRGALGIQLTIPFGSSTDYIHKVCFSNCIDLFLLCHENNENHQDARVVIYRVQVGLDTSIERKQGQSRMSKGLASASYIPNIKQTQQLVMRVQHTSNIGTNSLDPGVQEVAQVVFSGGRTDHDIEEIFAVEHKVNMHKKQAILAYDGAQIVLIPIPTGNERREPIIALHQAERILRLSNDTFVTIDLSLHRLHRVVVMYGPDGFDLHESIIYQDFASKMINVVGELDKLYLMVDDRLEVKVKVLSFEQGMTNLKVQQSYGEDFDLDQDHEFLRAFAEARFIASGCLIVSDWRLAKVSQVADTQPAIFQNYFHYLPEDHRLQDRCLLINQSKIGLKHRRQALVFNYPHSLNPKLVTVGPFFDDNRISLSQKPKQICWIGTRDESAFFKTQESTRQGKNLMAQIRNTDNVNGSMGPLSAIRIFQFMPNRWKLYEYDLAGLLLNVTSYDHETASSSVLCYSPKDPIYLVTPYGANYIRELQVRRITGEECTQLVSKVDLAQVIVEQKKEGWFNLGGSKAGGKQSVFEEIKAAKQLYNCSFEFKINSRGNIAVACILPSGFILSVYVLDMIKGQEFKMSDDRAEKAKFMAVKVQARELHRLQTNEVAATARQTGPQQAQGSHETSLLDTEQSTARNLNEGRAGPLSQLQQAQGVNGQLNEVQEACLNFAFVKKFSLSDKKLLMWNKKTILQGSIDKMQTKRSVKVNRILLEIAQLSDCLSVERTRKKLDRVMEQKGKPNSNDKRRNRKKKSEDDYFEQVECHDIDIADDQGRSLGTTMQVKIVTGATSSHIMEYNLDSDREVTWLGASQKSAIFFSEDDAFVYDEQFGIVGLRYKQPLLEFHAMDKNKECLDFKDVQYGVSWGKRMSWAHKKDLLIFANNLLLPHSYFNIIQRFRSASQDRTRKAFFVADFCKIDGANNLHVCKYDPAQIEKIIDCYWSQNSTYVFSVLINEDKMFDPNAASQYETPASSAIKPGASSVMNLDQTQDRTGYALHASASHWGTSARLVPGSDILETQISISSYRLINKILFYLSKLPPQLSFYDLMPKFKDLTSFSFFNAYLDTWLQQTSQMERTQVLFTSMEKGSHHVPNESSYLDKDFFENYPVQNYVKHDRLPSYESFKKFENANMHQVSIQMVQVSWLKDQRTTKEFFQAMVDAENLDLFKNRNMVELISYVWNISRTYFVWHSFVPFLLCLYLPITTFCFIPVDAKTNESLYYVQLCCLALTGIYLLTQLYSQLNDMCKLGFSGYFSSFSSMYNLLLLVLLCAFVYYSASIVVSELNRDVTDAFIETFRVIKISVILILNVQLFRLLKIFQFFQSFIRQFLEICKSTAQIASMLLFVITVQAIVMLILDENSINNNYRHMGVKGFFHAFVDSYMLAIGEFEPIMNAFVDNTDYIWLFWVIFILGTIMSLVLLLNMVIAVMSMSLETVVNDQEALVNREKLIDIIANFHRFPRHISDQLRRNKYLFVIEVDPQFDLDKHMAAENENAEQLAAQERQQAAMQAQLELFQAQMLTMMADSEKQQKEIAPPQGGMPSHQEGGLGLGLGGNRGSIAGKHFSRLSYA